MLTAIPPQSPLFEPIPGKALPYVPVMIMTLRLPPKSVRDAYPDSVIWVVLADARPDRLVTGISDALTEQGCTTVLLEGGGQVLALFLEAHALAELHLTLAPVFLGGNATPNLLSDPCKGFGFAWADAPRADILALRQIENEVFLHLSLRYPVSDKLDSPETGG